MAQRRASKPKTPEAAPDEISEAEQWRVINESRILQKARGAYEPSDTADEIFNAIILIIPFSFLYLMMDILINVQYGKHPPLREYAGRLMSAMPVLSALIFYVNRYKSRRITQLGLFLASMAAGTRLIWIVNRASWHVTIRQGPPLATIWIYTVTVLDLLPAVIGLVLVAVWFRWSGMKLAF